MKLMLITLKCEYAKKKSGLFVNVIFIGKFWGFFGR